MAHILTGANEVYFNLSQYDNDPYVFYLKILFHLQIKIAATIAPYASTLGPMNNLKPPISILKNILSLQANIKL